MDEDVFQGRLLPGERLAWTGQPGRGLLLTRQDIFLIPFSLIWCGFAIFWTGMATRGVMAAGRAEVAWFPLFGLAFICVGLYFVAGRFVVDAWIRGQVRYALTNRRVLISRTGPFSAFSAVNLDRLPDARLTERRDGRGTIRFGQPAVVWAGRGLSTWAPALDPTPQFLAIPDARRVFDLVQRAAASITTLPVVAAPPLSALVAAAGAQAQIRFLEFFAVSIRNTHTRRAYSRAVVDFLAWCEGRGVTTLIDLQPLHVGAYIESLSQARSAPTAKQHLAAIRRLFDWLVIGQVVPFSPAASVRGPAHSARSGKTPVLDPAEARQLIDAIDVSKPVGLRDRALIGLMAFSFSRIGAATAMKVEDVFVQNRRLWVRLHEKGGKRHEMPCHHALEDYLHAYIDGCGLGDDPKGPLFRTIARGRGVLTATPLPQANAHAMVGRRAAAAGIATKIGNHTFRATGITAYLKNGGTLENAAAMANHASTRTTQLYDRRRDEISLDEVERVRI